MYKHLVYTLLMAVFILGCTEPKPKEREKPPPPPPPSAKKLADGVIRELKISGSIPNSTDILAPAVMNNMKSVLREQKGKLSKEVNGEQALTNIRLEIDGRIAKCAEAGAWSYVLGYIELHLMLKPNSQKHALTQERAIVQLKRPVVTIRGILTDVNTKRKKALLEITLPLEGVTYSERMAEGEQLHGLKFVSVIGNNQGISFNYIEADESFDVFMENVTD